MTQEEAIAYCAGLFDGEGCILITRRRTYPGRDTTVYGRQPNWTYRMDTRLNQVRPESVMFMQDTLGGTVFFLRRSYGPIKGKIYAGRWSWEMADAVAVEALHKMMPFLCIKKAEAELAIKFQASKFPDHNRYGRSRKLGRTPEEIAFQQWCFEEMKRLKQVHNDPSMQEHYMSIKDSLRRQSHRHKTSDPAGSVATRRGSA